MNDTQKKIYLKSIREATSYPVYRTVIGLLALIHYLVGGLLMFLGMLNLFSSGVEDDYGMGIGYSISAVILGLITILVGKLLKEGLEMLADISDSIVEKNSRS